jgi:hypothetical protein
MIASSSARTRAAGDRRGDTEGDDFLPHPARTHPENETTARDRRQSCDRPGQDGSGPAEQVGHDRCSGDAAGGAQDEPERGVGVEAVGEVGMVVEADQVEACVVGEASVPEHLVHLVHSVFQPEAEEDLVVRGHDEHCT